jgi:tellurite resistance protein TerC
MNNEILFFIIFLIVVLFLLFLDLGIFSKRYHAISFRESLGWTTLWVSLALGFYVFLRFYGHLIHNPSSIEEISSLINKFQHPVVLDGLSFEEAIKAYNRNLSLEYLTGYIIEYSLSVDNVFVILLIFLSFGVDPKYYKKVLFWGILGAIVMRFIFIFLLSALIIKFHWIIYVFGGFLVYTGGHMLWDFIRNKKEKVDIEKHIVVRFASRHFNVYPRFAGHRFWLRENGKFFITPLFLVLLVIEFSDVIFAVDSVPAIFSVTLDPYIVFFSNIFAIIGLRSLFFLVSSIMEKFWLLKAGLAVLLAFVGLKMLAHSFLPIDTVTSLVIIVSILFSSVLLSLVFPRKEEK